MDKARLEAFSDGVIAILITIMVLELKIPVGDDLAALQPLVPLLLSYVLSFVYLGITLLLSIPMPWKATTSGVGFFRSTDLGTTNR